MCGPTGKCNKFLVVTVLNLALVAGVFGLVRLDPAYPNNDQYSYTMAVMVLLTQLSMCYVATKDPGFINPATHDSASVRRLTRVEKGVNDVETPFYKSHIYEPRFCQTCKITRPPLASHCNFCDACVIKFDHHCTVINQCIGARNRRPFLIYLILSFLTFLYLTAFTLYEFIWQDMIQGTQVFSENEREIEIILDSCILVTVLVKLFMRECCSKQVGFGAFVIWVAVEVVVVQALCFINVHNWYLNLAGLMLCIGSTGAYFVWSILRV